MAKVYQSANDHLAEVDPIMARLIAQWGPCTIAPNTDFYHSLVSSIISQQLSVKAASTIEGRFVALFDGQLPTPAMIMATNPDALRGVGLSGAKVRYVQDLAVHILDGRLLPERLPKSTNTEIIAELTAIKGIGEWTAHMFLMFCLGRQDVLPVGDLGVRTGIMKLYSIDHMPSPLEVTEIAAARGWAPYESIACWYIWRSLGNKPA